MIQTKTIKGVLIVLAIFILLFSFTQIKSCIKTKKSIKITTTASNSVTDTGIRYIIKNGVEALRKEQIIADKNTIDILFKKQVDSILKIIGSQKRQLQEFAKIDLSAIGNITSPAIKDTIILHDTIKAAIYSSSFADSLIDATAIFNPEDMTMSLFYDLNLSVNYIVTSKRKPRLFFWKKKKAYVDVFSNNKNVKIKSFQSVKIKPE